MRRKLNAVLDSDERHPLWRQLDIRYAMEHFLNALDLSIVERFLHYDDYNQIIKDSVQAARDHVYVHHWQRQQMLLVSSKGEMIHCRVPAEKSIHHNGGPLFAKAIRGNSGRENDS